MSSWKAFWTAAFGLAVALTMILPVVYNGEIALPDEGVYSAQARAVANGAWSETRPATVLHPPMDSAEPVEEQAARDAWARRFDPVGPSVVHGDERIPYTRHPLYSRILSAAFVMFDKVGLLAVSMAGGFASAVLIGLVCRQFNPRYGIPGMLLAGSCSPLLFNSFVVVAHTWATAFVALLVLGLLIGARGTHRWQWLPYVAVTASAFALPMLRTEASIVVGAAAVTTGSICIVQMLRRHKSALNLLLLTCCIGLAGSAGWVIDLRWTRSIQPGFGGLYANPAAAVEYSEGSRLRALWTVLLQPWTDASQASFIPLIIFVTLAVAVVAIRVAPSRSSVPALLTLAVAVMGVTQMLTSDDLITGLVPAFPLLIFILVWSPRSGRHRMNSLLIGGITAVSAVALAFTIYPDGGATQWGGRLFQVLLPMLIPMTLLGLARTMLLLEGLESRVFVCSIAVIALASASTGLAQNRRMRIDTKEVITVVRDTSTAVRSGLRKGSTGSGDEMVVAFSFLTSSGGSRMFWEHDVELNLVNVGLAELPAFMPAVDFDGDQKVLVFTDAGGPLFTSIVQPTLDEFGLSVEHVGSVDAGSGIVAVLLSRSPST